MISHLYRRRHLCGALVGLVVALALGSTASADVATFAPNALSPVKSSTSTSLSPQLAGPAPTVSEFTCNNTWDPIANEPNNYIIGECGGPGQGHAWHLHRQAQSSLTTLSDGSQTYFDGGLIFGDFNHCGWIDYNQDTTAPGNPPIDCSPNPTTSLNKFAAAVNCAPHMCGDGTPTYNSSSCLEVENVSPWLTTPAAVDALRYVPADYRQLDVNGNPTATSGLRWRYIVGNGGAYRADAYGNYWVEVRDTNLKQGQGNWVFVPLSCLATPLSPGPGGYYFP